MTFRGIVKGHLIELDERPPFPEGTRVEVTLTRQTVPRRSSPEAVLRLVGTLTDEEVQLIRKGAAEIRDQRPRLPAR